MAVLVLSGLGMMGNELMEMLLVCIETETGHSVTVEIQWRWRHFGLLRASF
jgi:hypothetical protein